jgi:hypothetical protein
MVEPAKASFVSFLCQFTTEEMLTIIVGLAPAESGCFKPWRTVFLQEDRKMVAPVREPAEVSDQCVSVAAISVALAWEHPREKAAGKAPRTIVYLMKAAEFMELVKIGITAL